MLDWSHPIAVGLIVTSYGLIVGGLLKTLRVVNDLRGILTGPDGTNGVRGDVRELIEERRGERVLLRQTREEDIRERERLSGKLESLQRSHDALTKRVVDYERTMRSMMPHKPYSPEL